MRFHFLVLGEEKRQHYLSELLKQQGHEVRQAEDYVPGYHHGILLPVPQSAMYLEKIAHKLQRGQLVYGCNFPKELMEECEKRGVRFVDYMKQEGIASRNAVATAEGAIVEALKAGCTGIQGSFIMVVGYGTCGAALADKLLAWKAHVIVVDRKEKKREMAKANGCQAISFSEIFEKIGMCDLVFNTVPAMVLTDKELCCVGKEAVIIDIASRPGGVDYEYCQQERICANLCLGLPGKYAPKSAASILMEVIMKTILGDWRNGQ